MDNSGQEQSIIHNTDCGFAPGHCKYLQRIALPGPNMDCQLRCARDETVLSISERMRYLLKAAVEPGQEKPLLQAIESGKLGQGSVASDENLSSDGGD